MAFGKDASTLGSISTFRQSTKAHQALRPKTGGGGTKPYYLNAFKPSLDEPDNFRIVQGNYEVSVGTADGQLIKRVLSYFPFIEHFHGTLKKGFICSAGPFAAFKGKHDPCLGCDMFWSDKQAGKKNGPMSRREMYSFTVLHYATFANVEQTDRGTGAVRTDSSGNPYMEWTRIHAHEKHKYPGRETRDASQLHWDLGFGHWTTLTEYDKEIGKSCKACGGRDTVKMEAWVCGGCGDALIEADSTTLSPKEIEDLSTSEVTCGTCKHVGYMNEIISCQGCSSGARAEIFDVDLSARRIGDPKGGNQTSLAITSWSNPRPVDVRFADMAVPMDLAKIFTPMPIEKQAELLGQMSTRQPVTPGQHSRAYQAAPTLGGTKPTY